MINSSWIWLIHLKLQWTLFWVNGTPSWNPCLFCPFKRLSRQSLFLEFWFLDISFQDLSYFCQVESHEWHFFSSKNPPHPSPHKKKNKLHDFVKVRLLLTWSIWTVAPVAGSYDGVALDEWPGSAACRCELVIPGSLGWKPMVTVERYFGKEPLKAVSRFIEARCFFPHHRFLCWLGSCWTRKRKAVYKWMLTRVRCTSDAILGMMEVECKVYQPSRSG